MLKKRAIFLIKLLLTATFLYLLWRMTDQHGLAERMANLDMRYLGLFVLVGIAMLLVSNAKWHVLMAIHGPRPGFWATLRIYFIGYYFSALLPSNFGGDAARAYLAGGVTGSSTSAATSVFMERVTGLVVLFALVAVMPLIGPPMLRQPAFVVPALACGAALVVMLAAGVFRRPLVSLVQATSTRLLNWKRTRRLAPLLEWLGRFFLDAGQALSALGSNRTTAFYVWLLTAVFYLLVWFNILVAYRTFGFDPPMEFVFVTPYVQFAASLPVAVGGNLGYSEGVFAYYYSLIGIAVEATLAIAILTRLKTWTFALIGMGFFLASGQRSRLMSRPARSSQRSPAGEEVPTSLDHNSPSAR